MQRSKSGRTKRQQPRKDSNSKRVNFDNERVDKFEKWEKDAKDSKKGPNDIGWYARTPELLKAAASVPFITTTGAKLPFTSQYNSVPGVMTLTWAPVLGGADGNALHQAQNSIYSFTVHANSRNKSYDAADEMLLIIAGASLFSMVSLGIHAYGLMRRFNGQDMYTPEALVTGLGFSYTDLRDNLSNMWFDLNEIIAQCSQIWLPKDIPLIERWYWMNANTYRDAQSVKAQYYQFTPACYLVYNETKTETGGGLDAVGWAGVSNDPHTWAQYKEAINSMLTALLESQDRGIIFGDILKAYGPDRIYALSPIGADYVSEPVYNVEVLSQIENASLNGSYPTGIVQDQFGYLQQAWGTNLPYPPTSSANAGTPSCQILNFHQLESPTPEQIMIATRLKTMGWQIISENSGKVEYQPICCGTELLVIGWISFFQYGDDGQPTLTRYSLNYPTTTSVVNTALYYLFDAFDWAPWLYRLDVTNLPATAVAGADASPEIRIVNGDFDNYIIIDANTVKKMHDCAIYSELGVPMM